MRLQKYKITLGIGPSKLNLQRIEVGLPYGGPNRGALVWDAPLRLASLLLASLECAALRVSSEGGRVFASIKLTLTPQPPSFAPQLNATKDVQKVRSTYITHISAKSHFLDSYVIHHFLLLLLLLLISISIFSLLIVLFRGGFGGGSGAQIGTTRNLPILTFIASPL